MENGKLIFHIEDFLEEKKISKNKLCKDMDIPRTNLNRYCRNGVQRLDVNMICKLCHYLNVSVGDLIEYQPPTE